MILKVVKRKPETNSRFSLILEKPANFNFYAGQYLDVELPVNDPLGNSRAFTISSSPTEDFLMMTTKYGISQFKKALEKLNLGDTIIISHPAGTFTLDETSPAIFIAGGIGITPFRSMVKYALDHKLNTPITLLYSNSNKDFVFKQELELWVRKMENLKVIYHDSSQNGRLNKENFLRLYPIPYTLYPIFYLAGAPKMVDDFAKKLLDLGVDSTNIRYDRFDGY